MSASAGPGCCSGTASTPNRTISGSSRPPFPAPVRTPRCCTSVPRTEDGHRVVFTGSPAERQRALDVARLARLPEECVLAGRLRLAEFMAAIAEARLVVSADTGAAHLASAYSRPSVVLFGPAPAEVWGPPSGPHIVLTDAQVRRGDTFAATPDPALLAVSVQDVLAAVAQLRLA
jgi:ADP-heptose:LPS heptosyltransferase